MGKLNEIGEGWSNLIWKKQEVERVAKTRQNICNTCSYNSKFHSSMRPDVHCTHCGCTLAAKTRSMESECPIGKWPAQNKNKDGTGET